MTVPGRVPVGTAAVDVNGAVTLDVPVYTSVVVI